MSNTPNYCLLRHARHGLVALIALACPACQFMKLPLNPNERGDRVVRDAPPLPKKHQYRVADFIFVSDFEINHDQPLFHELGVLKDEVCRTLKLPAASQPVLVYLFEDRAQYERYTQARYPEVPRRRAFFVAQPRVTGGEDLLVFTFWGDHVHEDLRHELTHAILHGVLKDVPLWLDEGLAEYFEAEPGNEGVHAEHLAYIRQIGPVNFEPDLARLEHVNQLQQMTPREYREAWAWVHLMLHTTPDAKLVLINYLKQLRTNPNPGPLQPRLADVLPNAPASLRRHLANVDRDQGAARPLP